MYIVFAALLHWGTVAQTFAAPLMAIRGVAFNRLAMLLYTCDAVLFIVLTSMRFFDAANVFALFVPCLGFVGYFAISLLKNKIRVVDWDCFCNSKCVGRKSEFNLYVGEGVEACLIVFDCFTKLVSTALLAVSVYLLTTFIAVRNSCFVQVPIIVTIIFFAIVFKIYIKARNLLRRFEKISGAVPFSYAYWLFSAPLTASLMVYTVNQQIYNRLIYLTIIVLAILTDIMISCPQYMTDKATILNHSLDDGKSTKFLVKKDNTSFVCDCNTHYPMILSDGSCILLNALTKQYRQVDGFDFGKKDDDHVIISFSKQGVSYSKSSRDFPQI